MYKLTLVIGATAFWVAFDFLPAQDMPKSALVELNEAVKANDKSLIPPILEVSNCFQKIVRCETFDPASDVANKISAGQDVLVHLANEILADKCPSTRRKWNPSWLHSIYFLQRSMLCSKRDTKGSP
jgi:hypothetical protein